MGCAIARIGKKGMLSRMTQVDEWTPLVLERLTLTLGDEAPKLIALLKDTGAILSGGFVLNSVAKYYVMGAGPAPDLDIYVPLSNMPRFLAALVNDTLKFKYWDHFDATIYCRSFLRKNGIRRVHTFFTTNDKSVDVMAVRSKKTPADVCSNFDLTFCQVWFDGTNVFATHPDHIREKKGYLQGEYIDTFVQGNTFLKDRIHKYQRRGFTIEYDPSSTSVKLPVIADVLQKFHKCSKEEAREALLPIWFQRAATRWLAMSKENRKASFVLPLGKSSAIINQDFAPGTKPFRAWRKIDRFRVLDDEGYDSESMDTPRLTALAVEKYEPTDNELASKPLDPALVFGRQMFSMLQTALTNPDKNTGNYTYDTLNYKELLDSHRAMIDRFREKLLAMEAGEQVRGWRGTIEQLKERIQQEERNLAKPMKFVDYLHAHTTRAGTDFAADDGQLYDIHNHSMDAATTRDSLEGYLEQFIRMSDSDKEKGVPCYHKPTPAVRGQPEPVTNCTQNITMKEIQTIVSYEFFKRFSAPQPFKSGLNTVMPVYEAALPNTKALEEGYGDEYHETMCPFCLQTMSRGEGCSYMTHENPKRLDTQEAPFCQKEFAVQSLLDKYMNMGKIINNDPQIPIHLEVCVECGRPCLAHQHFDIMSAQPKHVAALRMEDPARPGRFIMDYATCAGGGRTELFARMLAVRDVYKKGGIKNPKEEREAAAKAADAAATDPAYLARGKAIADMPPAERKFNTKVPAIKKYNDPAYDDVSEENAQAAANAAANAAENAAIAAIVAAAPAPVAAAAPATAATEIVYPEGFPDFLRTKLTGWLNNRGIEPIDPTSLPDIEKFQIAEDSGMDVDDEDNVRLIRQLGEQQINATKRSSLYTLWKATDFRVNKPAFDKAYAKVVFHYWNGFTTKARIENLTVDDLMRVVMGARERRARDRGEAVPAEGIVYADGTPEGWKGVINARALPDDPAGFQSSPTSIGVDLTSPILTRLNLNDADKSAIYTSAREYVEEVSQYAVYRRLKGEEHRVQPPPHPAHLKTAIHQIIADCIILYMMKVRQLLDEKGFPDAVVPQGAVLGGPAAEAVIAPAAAANAAPAANAAANAGIINDIAQVMNKRERLIELGGETTDDIVYPARTPVEWKQIIGMALQDIQNNRTPAATSEFLARGYMANIVTLNAAEKREIISNTTTYLINSDLYSLYNRLFDRRWRPDLPPNLKTAYEQNYADCIVLYMKVLAEAVEAGVEGLQAARAAAPAANAAMAPAANAVPGAQLPVVFPPNPNDRADHAHIQQGLDDPPREREGPLEYMFTWVLGIDNTFGDSIDDVLFDVSANVRRSQVYRNWKEVNDAIRAGGPIPNTYDQLWAAVCLKYIELYLAQVAIVQQQGGRKMRKNQNRTYKRRGLAFTRSKRRVGRNTYKKRKVQRKTRRNH